MNSYELTVILRSNNSLDSNKENIKTLLGKYDITVDNENEWGNRRLAYDIDGEKEGFYTLFELQSPPDAIKNIISEFRINSDILRFFFVKMKKKSE